MGNRIWDALINDQESFIMFSQEHWITLIVVLSIAVIMPIYALYRLNDRGRLRLGKWIAIVLTVTTVVWSALSMAVGHYDLRVDLPLHLCNVLAFTAPLFAWKPSMRTHEPLYYVAMAGTFQALFTPQLFESFPHYDFLYYWLIHGGLVIFTVYATVAHKLYPTLKGILRTLLWINVYAAVLMLFNLIAGSNYVFLLRKPDTASLLDFFGPWPWYIFVTEFAALLLFGLCYLPFLFLKRSR